MQSATWHFGSWYSGERLWAEGDMEEKEGPDDSDESEGLSLWLRRANSQLI